MFGIKQLKKELEIIRSDVRDRAFHSVESMKHEHVLDRLSRFEKRITELEEAEKARKRKRCMTATEASAILYGQLPSEVERRFQELYRYLKVSRRFHPESVVLEKAKP